MAYLSAIHILSAVVWVGGMFFALIVLRPAAGPLEPAVRLALWRRVFARFFPAVGISVLALLATGHAMILVELGGFAGVGLSVYLMQGTGVLMALDLPGAPGGALSRVSQGARRRRPAGGRPRDRANSLDHRRQSGAGDRDPGNRHHWPLLGLRGADNPAIPCAFLRKFPSHVFVNWKRRRRITRFSWTHKYSCLRNSANTNSCTTNWHCITKC